jgi:hypothetical protein
LVPSDVRERVEAFTGHSLEESYEGLTLLLLSAILLRSEGGE